ncbi:MAG: hydantoinase/carbamoylase family amidase [Gemmatimonadota bacterium]|nr:MAG: hydantoinase/carbamoylase family amidase [Gemmatimonadota bacterium]
MILKHLTKFKKISATKEGVTRLGHSEWEEKAHAAAAAAFSRSRRVRTVKDQAGNTFLVNGTGPGPYVVMGSHLDTVPNGGWLDGALGVAGALVAMQRVLSKRRNAPLAVAIWADEEGYRFGNGLWGSRAFAGKVSDEELLLLDGDGVMLAELLAERGLQKKPRRSRETGELQAKLVYKPPIEIAAYCEAHIEQGGQLIAADKRIGIVTRVSGIRRWRLQSSGETNHAGTTPMRERRDALVPIAGMVGRLPQLVRGISDGVITCGAMGIEPGVANVIPSRAWAIVEHRAPTDRDQEEIARRLKELVATTGPRAPGVGLDMAQISAVRPTAMSGEVTDLLESVCRKAGVETMRMGSMAAHDAMSIAQVAAAGLFFIPSLRGVSHRPDEDSRREDIKLAGEILYDWALAELERVS